MVLVAASGKKLPPAPGCVDQQLTSLTTSTAKTVHEELDIPPAPAETPYALQVLLDLFRSQFIDAIDQMKKPNYKDHVRAQIQKEKVMQNRTLTLVEYLETAGVVVCLYWSGIKKSYRYHFFNLLYSLNLTFSLTHCSLERVIFYLKHVRVYKSLLITGL